MVILGLMLGFFPVLIFSWVYEMTPDGLRREVAGQTLGTQRRRWVHVGATVTAAQEAQLSLGTPMPKVLVLGRDVGKQAKRFLGHYSPVTVRCRMCAELSTRSARDTPTRSRSWWSSSHFRQPRCRR